MNILFSAGYLYRYPFANNNIEISLADQMAQMGHTCHVCGFSTDLCGNEQLPSGVVLMRTNPYRPFAAALQRFEQFVAADASDTPRAALARQFGMRRPVSAALVMLAHQDFFYKNIAAQYGKFVRKYVAQHQIDAMICFAYPFPLAKGAADAKVGIPSIYYQFDPHGLHESLPPETEAQRIADEVSVITGTNATVTTKALLAQYQQHPAYAPYTSKCCVLDFPTFGEKKLADVPPAFAFDATCLNLLFCGTLDDAFRSPAYFLQACVPLFEQMPNLRLYFLGTLASETLTRYVARYPQHIIAHPVVESDVASKTIAAADMLLNIGNSITNMMPSKIFDYFATGKPIVNVQKIANCPARPYFEQYPMQLTINEAAAPAALAQTPTEALAGFFAAYQGKQLPFAEVLPLYQTATPQYAAAALERIIKEVQP